MIDPPQKKPYPVSFNNTCQGHDPGEAFVPPTMAATCGSGPGTPSLTLQLNGSPGRVVVVVVVVFIGGPEPSKDRNTCYSVLVTVNLKKPSQIYIIE